MAKAKPSPAVPHRDQYSRLSYLHELATNISQNPKYAAIGRYYGRTLKTTAKKNVLRLSPVIKRSLCRNCDSKLIPGLSCSIRLQNPSKNGQRKHADVLQVTCKACRHAKNYPVGVDPRYVLWSDATEDVVIS